MSSQLPDDFLDSSIGDEWMMQEILQLLASDDSSNSQSRTASTSESSHSHNSNHNSSSSVGYTNRTDNSHSDMMRSSEDERGSDGRLLSGGGAICRHDDCNEDEENQPAQHGSRQGEEEAETAGGTAQQIQYPSYTTDRAIAHFGSVATSQQEPRCSVELSAKFCCPRHGPVVICRVCLVRLCRSRTQLWRKRIQRQLHRIHSTSFFCADFGCHAASQSCHEAHSLTASASSGAAAIPPPASSARRISTPPMPPPSDAQNPVPPSAPIAPQAPPTSSNILPTDQRVHVMDNTEFEDFRRRMQMQMTSHRYRKRKKEEKHQQNLQIQGRQAELVRLQELEAEYRQYQQHSTESLEEELETRTQEVNDLTAQVEAAAQEELYWTRTMSIDHRK